MVAETAKSTEKRVSTSLRLTPECKRLIKAISAKTGISQTSVIEMAVRDFAKHQMVK